MFYPELETLNNFCSSRFSQVCPDFTFLQNANLYRHTLYRFAFRRKGKSGHTRKNLDGQKLSGVSAFATKRHLVNLNSMKQEVDLFCSNNFLILAQNYECVWGRNIKSTKNSFFFFLQILTNSL